MDFTAVAFLIFIVVALNAVVLWIIFKNGSKDTGSSDGMLLMQKEMQELRNAMDRKMGETSEKLYESLKTQSSQSQDVIKSMHDQLRVVTKEISEVSESNKKVFDVGEQLQNLEKVLKHQKQRGNLGEASLQLALENILPATGYKMQYQFPDKETVDAVVITKDGMIPVDAKFSLDNYRRLVDEKDDIQREVLEKEFKNDLKKRIDETAKYIKPKDGTLPFAFM
ncbi:DNA recombination protein RmuC, partial [Candidatus Kaiserbacteria bacterium]|nr:DNA recombination protein RmuC [Candidatus Kaiserbacteria bacterium]